MIGRTFLLIVLPFAVGLGQLACAVELQVPGDSVRDFHKAAFVIQEPAGPAVVFGNDMTAKDAADKAVLLDGEEGVATDNTVTVSPPEPATPPAL